MNPAEQVQGTRHPPARSRFPRPWTAPSKRPTPAHPGGQTDASAKRGKKGPPTRPGPHHCPPHSSPTKGLLRRGPYRPGGASPPHHHRRPIHLRRPSTPLGPHSHPSDAPTSARPQRSRHPPPHRSTPKPQGNPTPPPLQDRTSHRIMGQPGHPSPNNPPWTSSKRMPNGGSSTWHTAKRYGVLQAYLLPSLWRSSPGWLRNFSVLITSSQFLWDFSKIPQKSSFFVIFWLATTVVACATQLQIVVLFHDFWRF